LARALRDKSTLPISAPEISTAGRRASKVKRILKSILFGATTFEMAQDALRLRQCAEQALMLVSIGDMIGFPTISYYRLKLIPYWLPQIKNWKTALLKEKDIIDRFFS
jgi:hypothetical protein